MRGLERFGGVKGHCCDVKYYVSRVLWGHRLPTFNVALYSMAVGDSIHTKRDLNTEEIPLRVY